MSNSKQNDRATVKTALYSAFGVKTTAEKPITSRAKTLNISAFNESRFGLGMPLNRYTFNEAAEMMRKDGMEGTDKQFDRMLARTSGVRLSNGVILKDGWANGVSFPTRYDD